MLRKILSTTAIVALLATGAAHAQDSTAKGDAAIAVQAPADATANPLFPDDRMRGNGSSFFDAGDHQILASTLLGWPVYGMSTQDNKMQSIGDVNDIVMAPDGSAQALVIGVGGFLGVGEKNVAVDVDRVSWKASEEGNYLSVDATREDLENAPAFKPDGENVLRVGAVNMESLEKAYHETARNVSNAAGTAYDSLSNGLADAADKTGDALKKTSDSMASTARDMTASVEGRPVRGTDMAQMTPVAPGGVSADQLKGAPVLSQSGDEVGEVSNVIMGNDGIEAYVADVGGFLGVGEKPVAIAPAAVTIMKDKDGNLVIDTDFDQNTLKDHVAYSADAFHNDPAKVLLN
ncbi:PRC-barrel domain containing protein [Martelella alba]|uniref:PRC-barrel domain containing protein n=1 Tax=Martelella alba TaxID=2590451 RepID=A0A506UDK0_9HYPH|nr:PRC-barrel domain-containing protein [Martelella alba]TPW31024.1 PRC-barrel domain containing protein [Martelella alba]